MEHLERHFDTAFDAPDGIKKLRELILALAMQGKLVPQDPKDQPASELLKEIEAEKKRLVKQGKIKEPKPLLPISANEIPYELPKKWEWARLRQICHDWGQQTPNTRFTYIDVGSIDNNRGTISTDTQILESSEAPSRARKIVRKGTVIYSTVRPYLLNAAVVDKDFSPSAIVSTAFAILHPYSGVDGRYIYFFLRSPFFVRYVEANQKGVAYPAINDGDLFAGEFPLPPAAEQQRIVAKIDELMARCDALEKLRAERDAKRLAVHTTAVRQLVNVANTGGHIQAREFLGQHFGELYTVKENVTELRKAILQLAVMGKLFPQNPNDSPASELLKQIEAEKKRLVKVGKLREPKPLPPISAEEIPFAVPMGWVWIRFFAVNDVKSELVSASDFPDENQIAPDSIEKGTGRLLFNRSVSESGAIGPNNRFYKGQILYSKIRPSLNKVTIAPYDGLCSADMYPINTYADSAYMLRVMLSEVFLEQVRLAENRVKMPKLNLESLSQFVIPLAPLAEQQRIVAKFEQLMSMCDTLEQQIDPARETQSAMLNAIMAQYGSQRCA